MKTDLLKEAIADAEAIKKLAIENAKASLNQAFDSKVKSMLAARLQEEAEEDEATESTSETSKSMEEAKKKAPKHDEESSSSSTKSSGEHHEEEMDEVDIDALLAEMEDSEGSESTKDEEANYYKAKAGSGPKLDEESSSTMEEEANYYKAKAGSGPKLDEESSMEETSGHIYEEMSSSSSTSKTKMKEAKKKHGEESSSSSSSSKSKENVTDEEVDLNALLKELEEGSYDEASESTSKTKMKEAKKKHHGEESSSSKSMSKEEESWKHKAEAYAAELNEIKRLANKLTSKVNETNLINAKLMYLNKILNKHNLNEAQKVRVINAFDKATSIKEAKIVFESLNGALLVKESKTKTNLKESLGFASKAAGTSTKRDIITEADIQVTRWQKLAGINKSID